MKTLVRLERMQEKIIEKLLEQGYYKTKSEAIRAGILELGKEHSTIKQIENELVIKKMKKISKEIEEGKIKTYPLDVVLKKAGLSREDLNEVEC